MQTLPGLEHWILERLVLLMQGLSQKIEERRLFNIEN